MHFEKQKLLKFLYYFKIVNRIVNSKKILNKSLYISGSECLKIEAVREELNTRC